MAFEKLFFCFVQNYDEAIAINSHRQPAECFAEKKGERQQHIDCGLTIEGWGGLSEYKRQFYESHWGGTFARQSLFRFALNPAISRVNQGNLLRQQV